MIRRTDNDVFCVYCRRWFTIDNGDLKVVTCPYCGRVILRPDYNDFDELIYNYLKESRELSEEINKCIKELENFLKKKKSDSRRQ